MITYQIEIQDVKSGKTVTMPRPGCGFTEDGTRHEFATRMCDCNLAGYFNADLIQTSKGVSQSPHQGPANAFRQYHGCNHTMPPTRFKAIAAHLDNGTVVRL
jgi:hypothetical protein